MPGRKEYQGGAPATTLQAAINPTVTTFTVINGSGFPTGVNPFVLVIGRGTAAEEKMLCSSRSGTNVTVTTRGYDGTSPTSHSAGDAVEHVLDADTINEANDHVNTTTRDDHTQYLNATRHDVTARHTFGAALGTPPAPSVSAVGDVAAAGAAGTPARSDHVHGRETFGAPAGTSLPSDTAAAGTSVQESRADHKHGREGFGNVIPVNLGDASTNGAMTSVSRSDHNHGWPTGAPEGTLSGGYAQVTANQTGITTATDLTGLAVTVTAPTGRRYKITGVCRLVIANDTDVFSLAILEGATQLQLANVQGATNNAAVTVISMVVIQPTSGSHTYKLNVARQAGTAAADMQASSTFPAFILVEDIGV